MPDPTFGIWRVLSQRLGGRVYAGELPVADGSHCWVLSGAGQTGLVAWTAQGERGVMRMRLADGPVEVVDAFGNRRTVEPREGVHTIDLGPRPLFIEGVDDRLASFRAAVAIEPAFVPARHQIHEHEVVLSNPWDTTIFGTIRLEPPPDWRITPRVHRFVVLANDEVRLPISIVLKRNTLSGHSRVEAEIDLTADREYRIRVHADLDVRLESIELEARWRRAPNPRGGPDDLVITQHVTNTGDGLLNLDVFVSAPGIGRHSEAIVALEPNQTTVRTFRLENAADRMAGRRLRYGVTERDGTGRLNRLLEIGVRGQGSGVREERADAQVDGRNLTTQAAKPANP